MTRRAASKPPENVINLTVGGTGSPAAVETEPEAPQAAPPEEKSPTWFWDLLREIPEHEWSRVYDVLLVRMGESKVAMAPGEKGYLRMFTAPVTLEEIRQKYGGGKYRCILEKNGRYKTSHDFEIQGSPIYDATRERPSNGDAPRGQGETALVEQFIEVLRDELQRSREVGQAPDAATDKVVQILSSASEKAMEMVTRHVPEQDGGNGIGALKDAILLLKELGLMGGTGGGDIMKTIAVLKELGLIGQPQPQADLLGQLKTMMDIYEKFSGLRGEAETAGPKDWKATAVQEGLRILGPAIDRIAQNPPRAGAQPPRPPAPAPAPAAAPARPMPAAAPAPIPSAPPPPAPTYRGGPLPVEPIDAAAPDAAQPEGGTAEPVPAAAAEDSFSEDSPQFRVWVSKRVVCMVTRGDDGESIVDFLHGAGAQKLLRALISAEPGMVTAFMLQDEVLKLAAQHPRWEECLQEAREYLLENEPLPSTTARSEALPA